MKMKLFHGSPIKNLKVLVSSFSDSENFEGKAIYLTDSFQVAKDYAAYSSDETGSVYEVEISDPILDLTTKDNINSFLSKTLSKIDIDWLSLDYTDAATNHILNHQGKNGVWCLDQDVSSIFIFEKQFKDKPDLEELLNKVRLVVSQSLQSYSVYKIRDVGNNCFIYIVKDKAIPVVK
jgi:hypothetical protein